MHFDKDCPPPRRPREARVLVRRVIDTCRVRQCRMNAMLTLPCGIGGGCASGMTQAEADVRLISMDEHFNRPGGICAVVEMTAPITVRTECECVCGQITVTIEIVLRSRCPSGIRLDGTLCATLVPGQRVSGGSQQVCADIEAVVYITALDTACVPLDKDMNDACCNEFFSLPIFPTARQEPRPYFDKRCR